MRFDGDIIITDPCYIIKDKKLVSEELEKPLPKYPHYENFQNTKDYLKAADNYYKELQKFDHWEQCNHGENMEILGITHCISKDTIYGDWSCTTFQHDFEDGKALVENISNIEVNLSNCKETSQAHLELKEELDSLSKQLKSIGYFCADAGRVAVFLLDEILKYNPNFDYHIERPWTTTLIKDFHGEVEYYIDDNTNAHIIGKGNINFITVETDL